MSKFVSALAGWKGYAALALFVAGIAGSAAGAAAWHLQALKYDARISKLNEAHATEIGEIKGEQAGILAGNLAWQNDILKRLSGLEAAAWEDLENARVEGERFRADLLSGAERMWVRIVQDSIHRGGAPGGSPAAGLDDEAAYALIHPSIARDLAALAADADTAARQLNLCQDRELTRLKPVSTTENPNE